MAGRSALVIVRLLPARSKEFSAREPNFAERSTLVRVCSNSRNGCLNAPALADGTARA
jgi:hypothetical protein